MNDGVGSRFAPIKFGRSAVSLLMTPSRQTLSNVHTKPYELARRQHEHFARNWRIVEEKEERMGNKMKKLMPKLSFNDFQLDLKHSLTVKIFLIIYILDLC